MERFWCSAEQAEEVYGVKVDADGTATPVGARVDRLPSGTFRGWLPTLLVSGAHDQDLRYLSFVLPKIR